MKQRLITAAVGIAVLIPVLLLSDTIVFPIAVTIMSMIAVWEMLGCIDTRKFVSVTVASLLVSGTIPMLVRPVQSLSTGKIGVIALIAAVMFIYMYFMLCRAVTSKGKLGVLESALTFLTTMYITVGFTSIQMVRDLAHGEYLYLLIFIGAWITDGAAYFVGRAFGKHKLIPDVSPKKTVEGAIGGSIGCALSFVLFGLLFAGHANSTVNIVGMVLAGLVISVISQFGDLIASLIKRHFGIKDYGKLFPGHGGVMDRFDSIIAISPFMLMICANPDFFALLI